jgi:hypothetical protein
VINSGVQFDHSGSSDAISGTPVWDCGKAKMLSVSWFAWPIKRKRFPVHRFNISGIAILVFGAMIFPSEAPEWRFYYTNKENNTP